MKLLLAPLVGLAGVLLSVAAPVPAAHADGGYTAWKNDKVYIVDHTSSSWQLGRAIEGADNNSPLDLVRVTKCPAGEKQCVDVRLGELDGPTVGLTKLTYNPDTHDIVTAGVTLDKAWGKKATAHERRAVVCHEVLHAVGMEHVNDLGSCLNPTIDSRVSDKPSKANEKRLRAMY